MEKSVKDAIDSGYRHIDTAFFYKNEKEVGNAIREKIEEGVVERSDMFITTKVSTPNIILLDLLPFSIRNKLVL